ncbi:helix-turn-helix domain-containing protein [Burkholderia sp. LMG 21824]|uniref:helix-turn-helix domain-containing protein n=1 Tax=Burkholderia sp. LMG 21824 TaxID=3158172 RepID=UPI003C2FF135
MNRNLTIREAIYNMGGATMAAKELSVSTSAVYKWIRLGRVPNLRIARKMAEALKCNVFDLRPPLALAS